MLVIIDLIYIVALVSNISICNCMFCLKPLKNACVHRNMNMTTMRNTENIKIPFKLTMSFGMRKDEAATIKEKFPGKILVYGKILIHQHLIAF